ncbi:MAG: DNA internalization-related competence protein ComEC/Rec2 [Pseudomonadota bacterium]
MSGFVLGLVALVALLHRQATLPEIPLLWLLLPLGAGLVLWARTRKRPVAGPLAGGVSGALVAVVLMQGHASAWLDRVIMVEQRGLEVTVTARIVSLPEHDATRSRFRIAVEAGDRTAGLPAGRELQVTAFPARPEARAGEIRRMQLRLRPAEGRANPGGFDRQAWFYRLGLHGSATLREWGPPDSRPGPVHNRVRGMLHRARNSLRTQLFAVAPDLRHPGLVQALIMGDRQAMTDAEWSVFLHTGTNHLMAISGLHVGLVAGFAGLLAGGFWSVVGPLQRVLRRPAFAALTAMTAAATYAALAGFSIPTQRALIMLVAVLIGLLLGRTSLAWRGLALAAVLVLVVHPPSILAAGFWFSFGAVAVILALLQGRMRRLGWRDTVSLQVLLALAMLPLSLAWFQLGSWIAPVANLLAVPLVSFLVLPLLLLSAGLAWIAEPVAGLLLGLADGLLSALVAILQWLAGLPIGVDQRSVPRTASLLGGLAVLLLVQPRARLVGIWVLLATLPLVLPMRPELAPGAFRVELFDVGNGSAILVRTREHALLYDAGYGREGGYSAGSAIVVPALRASGIRRLDRMILSHEHPAHAGGAGAIREEMPVAEVLRRAPRAGENERECRAGETWQWDGVRFRLLHPPPGWDQEAAASCVLKVENSAGGVLLSGALRGLGTAVVLRRIPPAVLDSEVLVLPRGMDRDGRWRALLDVANPRQVWASLTPRQRESRGDLRREVRSGGHVWRDTAAHGHLWLEMDERLRSGPGYRLERRRFWHTTVPDAEAVGRAEASRKRPALVEWRHDDPAQ